MILSIILLNYLMLENTVPNYKYTSDFDKKNEFNIEQFLSRRLKLKAGDEFVVVDAD